jgi:hypothetical protein
MSSVRQHSRGSCEGSVAFVLVGDAIHSRREELLRSKG